MNNDIEIFFNMINREIDNIMRGPLSIFSGTVKQYARSYIEPYLNFFVENNEIQTDLAGKFIEQELSQKIQQFKKEFNEKKEEKTNEK